jgi:hypothetical protein
LTAFGKVIYDITLTTIQNAINYYWKLKAIDSLAMSNDLPAEEIEKVVYNLIDNKEIKAVLVSDNKFESLPYAGAGQQQQKHLRQVKPELLVY